MWYQHQMILSMLCHYYTITFFTELFLYSVIEETNFCIWFADSVDFRLVFYQGYSSFFHKSVWNHLIDSKKQMFFFFQKYCFNRGCAFLSWLRPRRLNSKFSTGCSCHVLSPFSQDSWANWKVSWLKYSSLLESWVANFSA